jgi:glycine/D-amino acid oxidase-like deaminating enzyme/nitrite reductase/ring-hydroxylating ferredoxin subunit
VDHISPNSLWVDQAKDGRMTESKPPKVEPNTHVEVAVVGAGITGLTAALHLKQAGKRVAVLEAGPLGAGTTGGTSGHLDTVPEQGARELIDKFGRHGAAQAVTARRDAIDQIETWCEQFAPSAEFARVPGYLYTEASERAGAFAAIAEALAQLGLEVSTVAETPLPFASSAAIRVEQQARFHPVEYLRGLAEAVQGDSGNVYLHTRALRQPVDASPCRLETNRGELLADQVVLATHSAFMGISQLDLRVAPYQSYVMAAEVADEPTDALYWDDASPYHYTRLASSREPQLVIVGGADHKTGQADDSRDHFHALEEYIRERWHVRAIRRRWSAEFFEPADGLPLVGRLPLSRHIYAATGFSGTGLTWGTSAGRLIADLILEHENPLAELLSPGRIKPLAAATDFVKENTNIATRFVVDRFAAERIDSLGAVQPGEGRLVEIRGKRVAAYRDPEGVLHLLSSVCTHAGCVVQWNQAERTWDCPCHGGRYAATGERIYGPAPADLEPVGIESKQGATR